MIPRPIWGSGIIRGATGVDEATRQRVPCSYRRPAVSPFGLTEHDGALFLGAPVNQGLKSAGAQLAALRKAKGLSQMSLSEIAGLHPRTVQRAEAGKCCYETLSCMADALGADLRQLLEAGRPAPQLVAVEGERADAHVLLSKVEHGKALLDLLGRAVAVKLDHDPVTGEEAAQVGAFLQILHGWCAVVHELEPGERVAASARLHERIVALQERGFNVVAGIHNRPLMVEPNQQVSRPVATVGVYRVTTSTKATRRGQ